MQISSISLSAGKIMAASLLEGPLDVPWRLISNHAHPNISKNSHFLFVTNILTTITYQTTKVIITNHNLFGVT